MEWDVFICHASEDKEDFVRPLAEGLQAHGLKIWYDDFTLTVGDSLRRSIDRGLAHSKFGVVVISPNFMRKEWPQRELDGLVARELASGKVILPVWHQITVDQVRKYSPVLADRVAVSSSAGLDKVIKELLHAIGQGEYGVRNRRQKSAADHERGTSRSEPNAEVISAQAALERERRLQDKQNQAREGIREAAPSVSALQMTVGETGPYFDTEDGVYDIKRTFNLKLENTDRNKSVSNCSVQILSVTPPTDYEGPWRLGEGLELASGDYVFIPLVTYGEAREPDKGTRGDTFITMGTENGRPHLDVGEKYTVALRATAPGTPYCEYQCRVWVDENGRLRIEED